MQLRLKFALLLCLAFALCFNLAVFGCPTPEPKSITPANGLVNETVTATIDGTLFHRSVTVKLAKDGQPDIIGTIVKRTSTKIICTFNLNNAAVGPWDVVVTSKGTFTKKLRNGIIKDGFTVVYPAPTVTTVSPDNGDNDDVYSLDITGTEFRNGATVKLSDSSGKELIATNVAVKSGDSISCDVDLNDATPQKYNVIVTNDDNQSATLNEAFEINETEDEAIEEDDADDETEAVEDDQSAEAVEDDQTAGDEQSVEDNQAAEDDQSVEEEDSTESETPDPNSLLKPIFFDYDQYQVRRDQIDQLDKDIEVLKENDSMIIVLGGHADERGTIQYNIQLSALRAEAVKNYLISKGVDPSQITTYAYGKDHPAKAGHNEESWSFNRRVDISLWESAPTKDDALTEEVNP